VRRLMNGSDSSSRTRMIASSRSAFQQLAGQRFNQTPSRCEAGTLPVALAQTIRGIAKMIAGFLTDTNMINALSGIGSTRGAALYGDPVVQDLRFARAPSDYFVECGGWRSENPRPMAAK
jgi:hypothetical protein